MQQREWYMLIFLGSINPDRTCGIKYDKTKASIKALVSLEIVLLTTLGKVLVYQAIEDTQLFSRQGRSHVPQ